MRLEPESRLGHCRGHAGECAASRLGPAGEWDTFRDHDDVVIAVAPKKALEAAKMRAQRSGRHMRLILSPVGLK